MSQKILCAVDETDHSKHAIDVASKMAKDLGAELTLCSVNVLRSDLRAPPVYAKQDIEVDQILSSAELEANRQGAGVSRKVILTGREAAAAIVEFADAERFDHIVTGTGDKSLFTRLVSGSVAQGVVRHAHCSVTVAR